MKLDYYTTEDRYIFFPESQSAVETVLKTGIVDRVKSKCDNNQIAFLEGECWNASGIVSCWHCGHKSDEDFGTFTTEAEAKAAMDKAKKNDDLIEWEIIKGYYYAAIKQQTGPLFEVTK